MARKTTDKTVGCADGFSQARNCHSREIRRGQYWLHAFQVTLLTGTTDRGELSDSTSGGKPAPLVHTRAAMKYTPIVTVRLDSVLQCTVCGIRN